MQTPDLNLLLTLDVLLTEGSVARAAERLQLSPSAMSRALSRLRESMNDPVLVRAGRGLVPTPRALALQQQVSQLVADAKAVLQPAEMPNLENLERTFTLRTREGFVENFGIPLIERVRQEAPGIQLRFVQKTDKDSAPLRDGTVDMETGVLGRAVGPEVRMQALFRDRFIGVVRKGHSLSDGDVTPARYAAGSHVTVARRSRAVSPVDEMLEPLGLERRIVTIVSSFATALSLARASDLIATVPERYTGNLRAGMHSFPLPVEPPGFTISLFWHPRMDADPVHRWLRGCVREICTGSA
ncbi:LysR family transcriptional regulator [uncultured Nisaea sp.]|uniref:LysR family transcriptional regulator n=1 Tax=uncultured Nisaea sp. TaxID=538215 RepID=UPI0030ED19EC|tara:strand:- start:352 stop:1248 length:897 start_codon:yes stop_codon:yes gene_type:complete